MKRRTSEAQRLEEDYLARAARALAGEPEKTDILQSIQDHIAEALADKPEPVTLSAVAEVLERLGPPEDYGRDAPAGPMAPAVNDLHGCFLGAVELYKRNFLTLIAAAAIFEVLSLASLLILLGPLTGGLCRMFLNAQARPDKRVVLSDLFSEFNHFWPLLGASVLSLPAIVLGFAVMLVPGFLLGTLWMYHAFFIVERGESAIESLRSSWHLVTGNLRWNLLVGLILLAIGFVPGVLGLHGAIPALIVMPLGWMVWGYAYLQQRQTAPTPTVAT